jgi:anti-sigma factor (TIGR02949 family)
MSEQNVGTQRPRGLDCVHVIRRLWDYLDGRVHEDEREQIVEHLAWCNGCASHYQFEREFLAAVGQLRRSDENYDALRSEIVSRLRTLGLDKLE